MLRVDPTAEQFNEEMTNVFLLWLSGIVDMKNEKEIWWEDERDEKITLEFPTGSASYVIMRGFYFSGALFWETEWRNGKRDGYSKTWYPDGTFGVEYTYKDGELTKTEGKKFKQ